MINFKNLFTYESNIGFNEMPLIYQEKDVNSSSNSSLTFAAMSENSGSNYVLRESVVFPLEKRNSAINIPSSLPIHKSINNSSVSVGDSSYNNGINNLNKTSNGETHLNSYLMFEESDDSSFSNTSGLNSDSQD